MSRAGWRSTLLLPLLLAGCAGACASTRVLIVTGLAGEAGYESKFATESNGFAEAFAAADGQITQLTGSAAQRESVQNTLTAIADELSAEDRLIFIYVGHGSYDGRDFRFNLPGPDMTAADLAGWLETVPALQLLIITSSASGAALETLKHERRALMTATRSGDQNNVTVFAGYLLEALHNPGADIDKDDRLSLTEAFDFAAAGVAEHYAQRRLMATEHPQLDSPPGTFMLTDLEPPPQDPALTALIRQRDAVEADIAVLKTRKADMTPDAYFNQLQQHLLELALLQKRLDEAEVLP